MLISFFLSPPNFLPPYLFLSLPALFCPQIPKSL